MNNKKLPEYRKKTKEVSFLRIGIIALLATFILGAIQIHKEHKIWDFSEYILVGYIYEHKIGAGVYIDGLLIKDGSIPGVVGTSGTPVDNQISVFTNANTIEGTTGLTYNGSNFHITGDLGITGTRITKGWFTDLQVTNAIAGSITGNAATVSTITGLAPDTATTQATQPNITSAANLIIDSDQVEMPEIGTATYDDVQDWSNGTQSAGIISGGVISDGGSGTVDVTGIKGIFKTTDSVIGANVYFDIAGLTGQALTDSSTNYIAVDYNAATPQFVVGVTDTSNGHTIFNIGKVYREGTTVDIISSGLNIYDFSKRVQQHHEEESALHFVSGAIVSEPANLKIAMTAGVMYAGINRIETDAINTNVADTFEYYYNDGAWQESDQTDIDNLQYNDFGTGLATLSNNQYGVHWVYKGTNSTSYIVYGVASYTLAGARAAQPPASLPPHVEGFGVLRAKVIILKSAVGITEIQSVEDTQFTASTASNHNELAGLQGGTAAEYYHLTSAEYTVLGTPEGTAILSTGEVGGTKYLREDGDGTSSWQAVAGGGDVTKVGTPVDNQVGVWTGDGTIEGTTGLTYDGSNFHITGDLGITGTRITKGWFTDLQVTNAIAGSITGNAATVSTITGLAPDTATTQATQPNITSAANLVTVGTLGTGVWEGTAVDGTYVDIEGTEIKSTGEAGGTKFLREDGDGTCSWQAGAGGGTIDDTAFTGNGSWTSTSNGISADKLEDTLVLSTKNAQTGTTYTLALTDGGLEVTMANSASNVVTVPLNASVAFETNTQIIITQKDVGGTTIITAGGATLNGVDGGSVYIGNQNSSVYLQKTGTDAWISSGGGVPDGWDFMNDFARASDTTFTVTDNAINQVIYKTGRPIRYADTIGTWSYGIVIGYSTGTVTLSGAPMTTSFDAYLEYGDMGKAIQVDFFVAGAFADATNTTALASDMNTYFRWSLGKAYCVSFQGTQKTVDSGTENTFNVTIEGSDVSATAPTLSTAGAWVRNTGVITSANYDINFDEDLEVSIVKVGNGDAEYLTVSAKFILE